MEKVTRLAKEEERVANEKKRLTKEQLKNALEQAIQEKQADNVIWKSVDSSIGLKLTRTQKNMINFQIAKSLIVRTHI